MKFKNTLPIMSLLANGKQINSPSFSVDRSRLFNSISKCQQDYCTTILLDLEFEESKKKGYHKSTSKQAFIWLFNTFSESMVTKFLGPNFKINPKHLNKSTRKFVPFLKERNHLGRLISSNASKLFRPTRPK